MENVVTAHIIADVQEDAGHTIIFHMGKCMNHWDVHVNIFGKLEFQSEFVLLDADILRY